MITVVGSINYDYLIYCDHFPLPSETMFGNCSLSRFGGKGANQAVAASKMGAKVQFIGAVGADAIGQACLDNLAAYAIDTKNIKRINGEVTGLAYCTITPETNQIIVIPGANNSLNKNRLEPALAALDKSSLVIIQNELSVESNQLVIDYCFARNIPILYNPAPARAVALDNLAKISFLIPNEVEAQTIFQEQANPPLSIADICKRYPEKVIITHGAAGVYYADKQSNLINIPALPVKVKDTTGAGDCFVGAFAAMYEKSGDLNKSLRFATVCAGLKVQQYGAQTSIPTYEEVIENLTMLH